MTDMIFVLSFVFANIFFVSALSVPLAPDENALQHIPSIPNLVQGSEADTQSAPAPPANPSFARGIVNTNILTLFNYNGSQIYVYSSVANDGLAATTPEKWIFYYVPIMAPMAEHNSPWVWSLKNEVRIKLLLGDSMVEEMARKAIEKKYDLKKIEYSKYWDIAPLMIDSLTAYIVQGSGSPIAGIEPYHAIHPNSLAMIFRFRCSTHDQAQAIAEMLSDGEYEIEVAFYFAGFQEVSTNFVSITGDQIKGVSSRTAADGGNTNAEYIHRSQASKFVSLYSTNVQKMIYSESADFNPETLSVGMQETFISLMKQAMDELVQTKLNAQAFEQVWNSSDLNPNYITSELNHIFTYNKTATEARHDGSNYFDVNWQKLRKSATATNIGFWSKVAASLLDTISVSKGFGLNFELNTNAETVDAHQEIGYQTISDKYIHDSLQKHDVKVEWTGEKLEPRSFGVFKITELTDRLQTALISKQMIADKNKSAIIRVISTINTPTSTIVHKTYVSPFLTGEVKLYTGVNAPSFPWLLCDGSAVSRIQYQRLFSVTGERYGSGDGVYTFNLPDFRGRVPLGVDTYETRVKLANVVGQSGGNEAHQMTLSQLPAHEHSQGSLYLSNAGTHNHNLTDPGHDHGGKTGDEQMGPGKWGMRTNNGQGSDQVRHKHSIQWDYTRITIAAAGDHTHAVYGKTGSVGSSEAFSIMQPYQTINYIIYAD